MNSISSSCKSKPLNCAKTMVCMTIAVVVCATLIRAAGVQSAQEQNARALIASLLEGANPQVIATSTLTDTTYVDSIPFLGNSAKRTKVLKVRMSWRDGVVGGSDATDTAGAALECFIDSSGHSLLRVIISSSELKPEVDLDVAPELAAEQLLGHGERYVSYIDSPPQTSLLSILDSLRSSADLARQVEIIYVMHSWGGKPPRPLWIVTLRGIPPIPVRGPRPDQVPVYQRNHTRLLIDDQTGSLIMSSSYPQPPLKPDDPFKKAVDEYMRSKGK